MQHALDIDATCIQQTYHLVCLMAFSSLLSMHSSEDRKSYNRNSCKWNKLHVANQVYPPQTSILRHGVNRSHPQAAEARRTAGKQFNNLMEALFIQHPLYPGTCILDMWWPPYHNSSTFTPLIWGSHISQGIWHLVNIFFKYVCQILRVECALVVSCYF